MLFLFYLGWLLMVLALVSTAAETFVRTTPGGSIFVTPAYELWYAIWPGGLTITQIRVERLAPELWDPVITSVLALPAWLLLGLPGVVLAWTCRPGRKMTPTEQDEHRKHVDSLFLYDALAREAKRDGMDDGPDDMEPDHGGHEAIEAAERDYEEVEKDLSEEAAAAADEASRFSGPIIDVEAIHEVPLERSIENQVPDETGEPNERERKSQ